MHSLKHASDAQPQLLQHGKASWICHVLVVSRSTLSDPKKQQTHGMTNPRQWPHGHKKYKHLPSQNLGYQGYLWNIYRIPYMQESHGYSYISIPWYTWYIVLVIVFSNHNIKCITLMDIKSQHIITIWLYILGYRMIPLKNVGQSSPSCQRSFLWHRSASLIRRRHGGQTRPKWNGNGWWNAGIPRNVEMLPKHLEHVGKDWSQSWKQGISEDIGSMSSDLQSFDKRGRVPSSGSSSCIDKSATKMPQVPIFLGIHIHRLVNSACCLGSKAEWFRLLTNTWSTFIFARDPLWGFRLFPQSARRSHWSCRHVKLKKIFKMEKMMVI